MNPLLKSLIGSLLRKALTTLSGVLIARRALTDQEGAELVEQALAYLMDAIPLLVSAAWSYWDQRNSRKIIVTALTQPVGTTENDVKALIKSGAVTPSVATPPNTVPGVPKELLWIFAVALLAGCASTGQRPPTALEQKYYDVVTNVVPVVVIVTNTPAPVTDPDTGITTLPAVSAVAVTNLAERYTFTPNTNAQALVGTGGAVGGIWGVGVPVGAALAGLFAIWGMWRSRKKSVATAEELAQIIETGRQVLLTMPNGAKYEAAWKDWMIKHQAETSVIGQISQLVASTVSKPEARDAAQTIVNLIAAQPK